MPRGPISIGPARCSRLPSLAQQPTGSQLVMLTGGRGAGTGGGAAAEDGDTRRGTPMPIAGAGGSTWRAPSGGPEAAAAAGPRQATAACRRAAVRRPDEVAADAADAGSAAASATVNARSAVRQAGCAAKSAAAAFKAVSSNGASSMIAARMALGALARLRVHPELSAGRPPTRPPT